MRKPTEKELENYLLDTREHISKVQFYMNRAKLVLKNRANVHDLSKFQKEESDIYAVVVPEFKLYEYGTKEYKAVGDKLGPAWEHHLSNNPHHPEYHENGMKDMDLIYLIEMLCDWKAASLRNPNQNFQESLLYNLNKNGYDSNSDIASMFLKTAHRLGMFDKGDPTQND